MFLCLYVLCVLQDDDDYEPEIDDDSVLSSVGKISLK